MYWVILFLSIMTDSEAVVLPEALSEIRILVHTVLNITFIRSVILQRIIFT